MINKMDNGFNLTNLSKTNKVFTYVYPVGLMTPKGVMSVFLIVMVW